MVRAANKSTDQSEEIVIIGAGIIGLSIAAYLQTDKRKVTLIDRHGIANEASTGNAGALAFADIFPMASPGVLRQAPKWLLDPLGPLSIRPAYLPKLSPWLLRYWRASWKDQFAASTTALSTMMDLARVEVAAFAKRTPAMAQHIISDGALHVYQHRRTIDEQKPLWDARAQAGIEFQHLYGDEIEDYQPGLSRDITAATFLPAWQSVGDPLLYAKEVWNAVKNAGGTLIESDVTAIEPQTDGVTLRLNDGTILKAKTLVIAAGAWSHHLTRQLGDNIPLETERGYNTTLPVGAFDLKRQLIFDEHGFVVSDLTTGIRIGGAVEFGGLDAPPNYKRSEIMLAKAKRFMPDLKTEGGTQWMGYRPSLPDSLPVIGPATKAPSVFYAFGHGHLGLTQSMSTARLIADMIAKRKPAMNLNDFRADRF